MQASKFCSWDIYFFKIDIISMGFCIIKKIKFTFEFISCY